MKGSTLFWAIFPYGYQFASILNQKSYEKPDPTVWNEGKQRCVTYVKVLIFR